ncbi:hypothetical protein [Stutzerimonas frequens]|uniref:hypothetical protein n=1 Tax=Stutzerimonas frequens TaxID=2968969 RepID=UPI001AAF86EA|nr:hypothetical protein [Stutzerimonas frequens]QTF55348.1 hypothetical protein J4H94_12060 [Stutzerimonas frequens]
MQPFAMLFAIGLFFLFRNSLSWVEIWLFFVLLLALLLFLIDGKSLVALRSVLNYVSLFFISYVACRVLRSGRVDFEFFFLLAFFLWFFVSLVQTVYDSDFLTSVVSGSRTTQGRGVTGLAPEPTFLGVVYIFFIVFSLHLDNLRFRKVIIFLSVVGVVFFAKSTMALLFLILMLGLFLCTYIGLKSLLFGFFSLFVFSYLIRFLGGSRIYKILELLKDDPASLLLVDASINDRFFHVFFSLKGLVDNFLMPHGFNAWLPYVSNELARFQDVVIVEWFSLGGRIMSGYGAAFFELGIFAVIIPLALTCLLFNIYRSELKRFLFFFMFMNAIMFSAIPLGFPLFAFYIGFLSYLYVGKKGL